MFSAYLTVLRLITTVWRGTVRKLMFSANSVHKYHKSLLLACLTVLRLITTVWTELSENRYLCTISVHKYPKSCSELIWPFYDLLQLYDLKCQKTHIFAISVHKYHKVPFLSLFDRFTAYYNCMTWIVRKLIFSTISVQQVSQIVFLA